MINKRIIILGDFIFLLFLLNLRVSLVFASVSRLEIMEATLNKLEYSSGLSKVTPTTLKESSQALIDERAYWTLSLGSEQLYVGLGLGLESGYINGDTTYHISFDGGESELEFPLDNAVWGVTASVAYKGKEDQEIEQDKDKAILSVEWVTNIERDSGKMKDSDWLDGDGHPGLDMYTESDADLRANMVDLNFIYNFWPIQNISIGPMIGYRYQKFEYDINNYWGTYYDVPVSGSGKVLDYEVEYKIPYLGLNTDLLLGDKFQMNLRFGYSPWADAKDRDDHLLVEKLSTADCDGDAYLINLNAGWKFLPAWILQVGGEYVDINTKGMQHQAFYDGSGVTYDVNDKITSSSFMVSMKLKYSF